MQLSNIALAVENSPTLALEEKAKAFRAQGTDVISFTVGEPDFSTPEYIRQAGHDAIDQGFTRYTAASGIVELKAAICSKLLRDNALEYQPGQIVVSNGAKHTIYNACYALLNPGDEVIVIAPYWLSYPEIIRMCDGVPVVVTASERNAFEPEIAQIKAAMSPKTKAIITNSPGNPTGCVYSEQTLREIAMLALEHQCYIISDEIYEKLIYDGQKHYSIAAVVPACKDLVITVNGHSKAYAMTGWRIGYAASAPHIAQVMSNIQSQMTSNPNSIAQKAALTALTGDASFLSEQVQIFTHRRDAMVERINAVPGLSCGTPGGAFYIMINITQWVGKQIGGATMKDSFDFCEVLLNQAHVALVPGGCFGMEGFVRISYASDLNVLNKGVDRISNFLKNTSHS